MCVLLTKIYLRLKEKRRKRNLFLRCIVWKRVFVHKGTEMNISDRKEKDCMETRMRSEGGLLSNRPKIQTAWHSWLPDIEQLWPSAGVGRDVAGMSAKTGLAMEQMKSIYLTSQSARTLRKELSGQKMKLSLVGLIRFSLLQIICKKIAAKFGMHIFWNRDLKKKMLKHSLSIKD